MTLIDTPGTGSLSSDVSRRAEVLLPTAAARQDGRESDPLRGSADLDPTGGPRDGLDRDEPDDRPPVADAVLYLLRHVHAGDVRFLEAFQDDEFGRGTSVNTLGVLSRADEIGSCRLDALDVAARIADRYEHDPRMHRLCPVVVPVAGLVAQAGVTLREDEYRTLARLAAAPAAVLRRVLLTADRLTRDDRDLEVTAHEREHLLARLGLFGVRLGVDLVRRGEVRSASDLAAELSRRGGLEQLRGVVLTQFGERARLLTCRSAVTTLRGVLARRGVADPERLEARLEGVLAGAHGFVEVRVLDDLRSGDVDVPEHLLPEMERLLGADGTSATARLGLGDAADGEEVRTAALAALGRWRRVAESPLSSRSLSVAARTVVRSCEGVLADLPAAT
jgi:hypothetical protein